MKKKSWMIKVTEIMSVFLIIAGFILSEKDYSFLGIAFMVMSQLLHLSDRLEVIEKGMEK